jgi:hypothetical protein
LVDIAPRLIVLDLDSDPPPKAMQLKRKALFVLARIGDIVPLLLEGAGDNVDKRHGFLQKKMQRKKKMGGVTNPIEKSFIIPSRDDFVKESAGRKREKDQQPMVWTFDQERLDDCNNDHSLIPHLATPLT